MKDVFKTTSSRRIFGGDFVLDYLYLLYYKSYKINPNRGGSYIDFHDWIKNKKEQ